MVGGAVALGFEARRIRSPMVLMWPGTRRGCLLEGLLGGVELLVGLAEEGLDRTVAAGGGGGRGWLGAVVGLGFGGGLAPDDLGDGVLRESA